MKISNIYVDITENDLLGIVKEVLDEHVDIEGLTIKSIIIKEKIFIEGVFRKGLNFPFSAVLGIDSVNDNKLSLNIEKIKLLKIKIFKGITKFTLKYFLKEYAQVGIIPNKSGIVIDFNLLSPVIPFVDFKLEEVNTMKSGIKVKVENLIYSQDKEAKSIESIINESKDKTNEEQKEVKEKENIDVKVNENNTFEDKKNHKDNEFKKENLEERRENIESRQGKTCDKYTDIRACVEDKIPSKVKDYSDYIMIAPDLVALVYRLFRDKRVRKKDKIIAGVMLTYVAIPIDIIPEKVPVIGKIDDIAILFIGLERLINSVDKEIILDNWDGDENVINIIRKGVGIASNKLGGKANKFISFISAADKPLRKFI